MNRRFADAVVDEARTEDPIVLVQDYHFALLPRMIRERLPRGDDHHLLAYPVAESRGVRHPAVARGGARRACSARSILGFHTQFHCNNFFDTVDRFLEARVDRETFTHLATAAS